MGLDMNFYKKDFVEVDSSFHTRDKELFNFITTFVNYGDNEYSEYIRLNKRQINKIIKYLCKNNTYGRYNSTIAELNTCKENNQDVYICADW